MNKQQSSDRVLTEERSNDPTLSGREGTATVDTPAQSPPSPLPWLINCIVKRQAESSVHDVPADQATK